MGICDSCRVNHGGQNSKAPALLLLGLPTIQAATDLLERLCVVMGCGTFRTTKGCKFGSGPADSRLTMECPGRQVVK